MAGQPTGCKTGNRSIDQNRTCAADSNMSITLRATAEMSPRLALNDSVPVDLPAALLPAKASGVKKEVVQ